MSDEANKKCWKYFFFEKIVLGDSASQIYNKTIPWNIIFGLIYFQNNVDAASTQDQATDNPRNFGSIFMPRSFNFTAKIGHLIPVTFSFWRQSKVFLFGKTETEETRETRIKDGKTKCREGKVLLQVGFQISGFLGRLYQCVIATQIYNGCFRTCLFQNC